MRRVFVHMALLAGGALALGACGLADVRSPVPEFMRAKAADPAPRDEPVGPAWTACVKAELNSVIGKPLGTQTYRVTIAGDMIVDRRRVEEEDTCVSETYEPI